MTAITRSRGSCFNDTRSHWSTRLSSLDSTIAPRRFWFLCSEDASRISPRYLPGTFPGYIYAAAVIADRKGRKKRREIRASSMSAGYLEPAILRLSCIRSSLRNLVISKHAKRRRATVCHHETRGIAKYHLAA